MTLLDVEGKATGKMKMIDCFSVMDASRKRRNDFELWQHYMGMVYTQLAAFCGNKHPQSFADALERVEEERKYRVSGTAEAYGNANATLAAIEAARG